MIGIFFVFLVFHHFLLSIFFVLYKTEISHFMDKLCSPLAFSRWVEIIWGDISKVYCIKQFKTRIIKKVSSQNNEMKKLYFLTFMSCLFMIFREYRRSLCSTKCSFAGTKVCSSGISLTTLVHLDCFFRK